MEVEVSLSNLGCGHFPSSVSGYGKGWQMPSPSLLLQDLLGIPLELDAAIHINHKHEVLSADELRHLGLSRQDMEHVRVFWGFGENVRVDARHLLVAFLLGRLVLDHCLVQLPFLDDLDPIL